MRATEVIIIDGSTFVASDAWGDIGVYDDDPVGSPQGFFYRDARFLSKWALRVDGQRPQRLSVASDDYFSARFFLYLPTPDGTRDAAVSIMRHRFVADGFHEDIVLLNHSGHDRELELELEADADFANVFSVRAGGMSMGMHTCRTDDARLVLSYAEADRLQEVRVHFDVAPPPRLVGRVATWRPVVPARGEWRVCVDVRPNPAARSAAGSRGEQRRHGHGSFGRAEPQMDVDLQEWIASAPSMEAERSALEGVYRQSLLDLAALRFYPDVQPKVSVPAAGAPWFMALFGRDSLITGYQSVAFVPDLARATLRVLAALQGRAIDDARDEEPGKVLHEYRIGDASAFELPTGDAYYGSADATMLWLILYDEVYRWTDDVALVRELEPNARAALRWIDQYGDADGDGYVEYSTRSPVGLENQGWKDSVGAVVFADGSSAPLPRGTCELQGYAYDAKVRMSMIAEEVWGDDDLAARLRSEAADLKRRFNEDFWMDGRRCFALALDGRKRRVDSITSNAGQLLWSGIVDEEKAAHVRDHLMGNALFSGWGIRTMASTEAAYGPLTYHNGTVWPHDTSLIVAGLRRYGFDEEAGRVALGLMEAAVHMGGRLPEVIAGYGRSRTAFPVPYPTACEPQAWASAAPLLVLRSLLDLRPRGEHGAAALPDAMGKVVLRCSPKANAVADVRTVVV